MLSTEKMHNLEAEGYVLFSGLSEVFKPGRQDSQITLRDCSEEARGEPGYTVVFATNTR